MSISMNKVSLLAALLMGAAAASYSTSSLAASCSGANPNSSVVSDFKSNPSSVLNSANLASAIQLLAVTDSALLSDIMALAKNNPAQQAAIGQGLGQAATACVTDQAAYAGDIQSAVEEVGGALETAFNDASSADNETGDPKQTAAVTGGETITPTGDNTGGTGVVGGTDNNGSSSSNGSSETVGSSSAESSSGTPTSPSFSSTGASQASNVSPST